MGIDTGLNLIYNENFPSPNVNQPSQQFRDNFSVIKTALELFQAATNSSESIFDLNINQNANGIINIDANYTGNSFMLPIGDPSITPSSAMIKYNSASSSIQFYDGNGWRKLINQDSSGNVSLPNLTVTDRITTTNLTINSDPTVGTDAVRLSYLNTTLANMIVSGGYASYAQLMAEATSRADADAAIRADMAVISSNVNNSSSVSSSLSSQISNLSNAISEETSFRLSADTTQLGLISNVSNAIIEEANARLLADTTQLDLISNCVPISGGTMTGDLTVNNANIAINGGSLAVSGNISTNGAITAAGDISGLSDASLKDNVRTIENALDKIDNLRGVLYTRNDLKGNPEQIGLIAQEVKETIPQIVHETENGLLSVSYGNLVALLIEGIKDLRAEIEDIKKKIN